MTVVLRKMPAQTDSRMSPISLKILAHLSDGEWHLQEDVIDNIQYTIPPGEAHRIGQSVSQAKHRTRTMDEFIASGRRHLVVTTINSLVQNHRLERNTANRNEIKKLRLVRAVPMVFVVRSEDGNLTVHAWGTNQELALHIVDAWAATDDPETEAERVKEIFQAIPRRIEGRERIEKVCRSITNRLNIAATLRKFDETCRNPFGNNDPDQKSED